MTSFTPTKWKREEEQDFDMLLKTKQTGLNSFTEIKKTVMILAPKEHAFLHCYFVYTVNMLTLFTFTFVKLRI